MSFGAPIGTMVYTARVEGLADLQAIGQTLTADATYHALLARGSELSAGPAVDSLATPIHGELSDAPPPVGSVAVVTSAVMAAGSYMDAVAWSVDIAKHVEELTGFPTTFLTTDFGAIGQVEWISISPDAAAADAAGQKVNTDAGYIGKLEGAGPLFIPGSGHRSLATRVA